MRTSYGITAHKLKAAEQHIRTQIFPTERLGLLDEVYRVREAEERFQDGFIGNIPPASKYVKFMDSC